MLNIQNYYQLMNKAKKTMFIHKFSNKKKKIIIFYIKNCSQFNLNSFPSVFKIDKTLPLIKQPL